MDTSKLKGVMKKEDLKIHVSKDDVLMQIKEGSYVCLEETLRILGFVLRLVF